MLWEDRVHHLSPTNEPPEQDKPRPPPVGTFSLSERHQHCLAIILCPRHRTHLPVWIGRAGRAGDPPSTGLSETPALRNSLKHRALKSGFRGERKHRGKGGAAEAELQPASCRAGWPPFCRALSAFRSLGRKQEAACINAPPGQA